MTWSFNDSLAAAKDRVRLLIGDTDTDDQLVSNEVILAYLPGGSLEQATEALSAASVADAIAASFVRRANSLSAGSTSVTFGDQAKAYRELAASLRSGSDPIAFALTGSLAEFPERDPIFTTTLGDYP